MHLDADDVILPHSTEQLMEVMLKDPEVGLVVGDFGSIGENGEIFPERVCSASILSEAQLFYWIAGNFLPQLNPIHRREAYRKCGFYDPLLYIGEDQDIALRISLHYKVGYVRDIQGYYRVVKDSVSRDYVKTYHDVARYLKKDSILAKSAFYYWCRAQKALGLAAVGALKQLLRQPSLRSLRLFCELSIKHPLFLAQLPYGASIRIWDRLKKLPARMRGYDEYEQ
jgi:hypothetical protein